MQFHVCLCYLTAVVVGFQQTQYFADEEMASGAVEVCIQIFSPGPTPEDVDVDFSTRDGSAMGETPFNDT